MATFPAIIPDHPATKELKVRETRTPLGDGREYVVRFGLNPIDTTWRLVWTRLDTDELFQIEQFLEARAADGEPFEWQPPDATSPQRFRVDQWQPARTTPTGWGLGLVFRRELETATPLDNLFWVARFNSEVPVSSFGLRLIAVATLDLDGENTYAVFNYWSAGLGYTAISKFSKSGLHQWTSRISTPLNYTSARIAATPSGVAVAVDADSQISVFHVSAAGGAITWQRSTTAITGFWSMKYSSQSQSLILVGRSAALTREMLLIRLLASDGSQSARKQIRGPDPSAVRVYDFSIAENGSIVICGFARIDTHFLIALPADYGSVLATAELSTNIVSCHRLPDQSVFAFDGFGVGLVFAGDLSTATALNYGAVARFGVVSLDSDANGNLYIAGIDPNPSTFSGFPTTTDPSVVGSTFNVTAYGSAATERLSANSLRLPGLGPEGLGESGGARSMNIAKNRAVVACSWGGGSSVESRYALTVVNHSINMPSDLSLLFVGNTPAERTATYVGDATPTQPTSASAGTIASATWTIEDNGGTMSTPTLGLEVITGFVEWITYSRTLP